ncbi:MAG: toll/interleukin-1 receptor domain-containing protein [Burkholderiales bacterium]
MADIFLSYAREDEARIGPLVAAVQEQGWSVFWDRHIPAGQSWRSHLGQALRDAKCVVVVWTHHSVASRWVMEEAEEGQQRGNLVPVLLDTVELPIGFRGVQAGDLREWQPDRPSPQFAQLVRDIGALLGRASQNSELPSAAKTAATTRGERSGVSRARPAKSRFGLLNRLAMAAMLFVVAGIGYWSYNHTSSSSSPQTEGKGSGDSSGKTGAGRVKTAAGNFRFDRISGMSMGGGKLTVTQFGSRVDLPLAKITRVQFLPDNTVKIQYLDGKSEQVDFSCYWNAPVTFHVGEKEMYYGDCAALRAIEEIEFFH